MSKKTYELRPSNGRKISKILIALFLILVLLAFGLYWFRHKPVKTYNAHITSIVAANNSNNSYVSVKGKYLFSGTVMLGRAVETYANGNYSQPFSGMSTLGVYDASIADLECPVTNNNDSYQNEVNNLVFNCKPNWLPTLRQYFPIVNLSSNHLYDQSENGFNKTVTNLNQAGFQVVGNYNPHIQPDDCQPVVLPVHLQKSNGQSVEGSLPVAFCSYNYKTLFSPNPGEIESIKKWSKLMPVIALYNHGPEYQQVADAQTTSIAHQMIDDGASFVIGNGTHWVQNTEVYKGKLIAYSLGNFIFDQTDYNGRIALNLSVSMKLQYNSNLAKWLALGKECLSNNSGCFSFAGNQQLKKVDPVFSFDAVGSYGGYLQVATRANAKQQSDIEEIANWPKTQKLLEQ